MGKKVLLNDWFENCFVKEVKRYLKEQNLSFKILITPDNASGHNAKDLKTLHPNGEFLFLPSNTTFFIQPMDQGIIKTFRAYYVRHVYTSAIKALNEGKHDTPMAFWKQFNISHYLEIIKLAWEQVSLSTLNACWHQLWPEVVTNFQ